MPDFTLSTYKILLTSLLNSGYNFQSFEEFLKNPSKKVVILRHDVDKMPNNSLATSILENKLGIGSSYYFRIVNESNKPAIIKQIATLGHEIGYHYEDLTLEKGDHSKAIKNFEKNLNYFRQFYPVKTICMHGSPMSPYDSRDLWEHADYRKMGIVGEPYFDVDFSKVLYLTDTGRRWDGDKVSVRDKPLQMNNEQLRIKNIRSTMDIIAAAKEGKLPHQIMLTIHPQRWNDNRFLWAKELVMQNIKNVVKFYVVKK